MEEGRGSAVVPVNGLLAEEKKGGKVEVSTDLKRKWNDRYRQFPVYTAKGEKHHGQFGPKT